MGFFSIVIQIILKIFRDVFEGIMPLMVMEEPVSALHHMLYYLR